MADPAPDDITAHARCRLPEAAIDAVEVRRQGRVTESLFNITANPLGIELVKVDRHLEHGLARACGSWFSQSRPRKGAITMSSGPPHRVLTTGMPDARASVTTQPNDSERLDSTRKSLSRMIRATASRD